MIAGPRRRLWHLLPAGAQTILLICAFILAFAAATAPMVYLLRRVGVG